jgi:hypothetical protein
MRPILRFTAGSLLFLVAANSLAAQLGVERRIDRRLDRRADAGNPNAAARLQERNPNAWRMRWNNNQWWYYTPQNNWMYYDNNNWTAYDLNTYLPPRQSYVYGNYRYAQGSQARYYTGYRGMWGPPAAIPTAPPTTTFDANAGVRGSAPAGAQTGAAVDGAISNDANAPAPAQQGAPPVNAPAGSQAAPAPNPQSPAPVAPAPSTVPPPALPR